MSVSDSWSCQGFSHQNIEIAPVKQQKRSFILHTEKRAQCFNIMHYIIILCNFKQSDFSPPGYGSVTYGRPSPRYLSPVYMSNFYATSFICCGKPRLHEQFLCDKLYLTIFICCGKPRLHEQFLCDKFNLLDSLHKQFLFERLGSTNDVKKLPILCAVSSTQTIFCM